MKAKAPPSPQATASLRSLRLMPCLLATVTAAKKPKMNSSVLPVGPKPLSFMIASSAVPIAATTGEPTTITLIDSSGVVFAENGAHLEVAQHASLQLDDAPTSDPSEQVSLWQQGLAAWRATLHVNWVAARAGCVAVISGVTF